MCQFLYYQVSQFRCETPGCVNSAWTYREERGQFYLHQYLKEQPDLNYRSPAVFDEMINVLKFWLDLGVDGFRQDTVSNRKKDHEYYRYFEQKVTNILKYKITTAIGILFRYRAWSKTIVGEMSLVVLIRWRLMKMIGFITFIFIQIIFQKPKLFCNHLMILSKLIMIGKDCPN